MSAGQFILQAALIFLAIYLLNRYFSKTSPSKLTDTSGTIKPSKIISVFCVIVSGAMFSGGFWLINSQGVDVVGLGCAGMGLFGTIVMLPALYTFHNVSWDRNGIYGPTGKSFPKFPTKQIYISWTDVMKTDEAWSNYRFVEDVEGRRIFWGYWYHGERNLRAEIERRIA